MEKTLTFRLDSQQKTALSMLAAREGLKTSALVRRMIAAQLLERQSA